MTEQKHNFSPVIDNQRYETALRYICGSAMSMCRTVLDELLRIDTLTIFAHSDQEHDFIKKHVQQLGKSSKYSHGLTTYSEPEPINILGNTISYLGVRAPSPESPRPQIGYVDFVVPDLSVFRNRHPVNVYLSDVESGLDQPMVEISHPEYDVLGYVVDRNG